MLDPGQRQVFVVDDHPLVRESLKTLLDQQADLRICGEAGDSLTALERIEALRPHAVVLDLSLKDSWGIDLIKSIGLKSPNSAVLVLSMYDERLYAERCIQAGARGYVMKAEPPQQILTAVREILAGRRWLSDDMAEMLDHAGAGGLSAGSPLDVLSNRELEVFNLLGLGIETRQIAEMLRVSIKTVQVYCARIKTKLHISNARELLREAVRWHERQSHQRGN